MLEMFCTSHGWPFEIISDLGSGMNYNKRGLKKLLQKILNGDIGRLVLTHKDRLLRFGAPLLFKLCDYFVGATPILSSEANSQGKIAFNIPDTLHPLTNRLSFVLLLVKKFLRPKHVKLITYINTSAGDELDFSSIFLAMISISPLYE